MRTILKLLVSIIGVAAIVFGIIFIFQSCPAKKQVADNIAPVTLSQLNATYNTVTANLTTVMQAEEPNIQAGTAQPSATFAYLSAQQAGLGLAKSNVGTANMVMMMGIVDVIIGLGLVIGGVLIPGKAKS
ncbi:MAG: hypothetical protein ACLPVI_08670 [Dehalococcoidales bacterium]